MIGSLVKNYDAEESLNEPGEAQVGGEEPQAAEAEPQEIERGSESEGEGKESGPPEPDPEYVLKTDYDRVHREAVGRKHTIKDLKNEVKRVDENILALRDEMFEALRRQNEPVDPQQEAIDNDPAVRRILGHVDSRFEEFQRAAGLDPASMYERDLQAEMERENQERQQELYSFVNESRERFERSHPDYKDAFAHALNSRVEFLKSAGLSDLDAGTQVNEEVNALVQNAYENGLDPAEIVYNMAKTQFGYSGQQQEQQEQQSEAPQAAQNFSTMNSVDRIRRGVQTQSVGPMGGSRGGDTEGSKFFMTREEFFDDSKVPPGKRLEILSRDDKWVELGKTGKIEIDW